MLEPVTSFVVVAVTPTAAATATFASIFLFRRLLLLLDFFPIVATVPHSYACVLSSMIFPSEREGHGTYIKQNGDFFTYEGTRNQYNI